MCADHCCGEAQVPAKKEESSEEEEDDDDEVRNGVASHVVTADGVKEQLFVANNLSVPCNVSACPKTRCANGRLAGGLCFVEGPHT